MNRIAGGDIFANIDKSNVAAERLFLNFQWIHWSEMTVLYLYLVVWGATDWAFSISGSNGSHTVVLMEWKMFLKKNFLQN